MKVQMNGYLLVDIIKSRRGLNVLSFWKAYQSMLYYNNFYISLRFKSLFDFLYVAYNTQVIYEVNNGIIFFK